MEVKTYTVCGFGTDRSELDKISVPDMIEFAKKHTPELCRKAGNENPIKMFDCFSDFEGEGFFAYLAEIISNETGIDFTYARGDDEQALMFTQCFPWELRLEERNLTPEKIEKILASYFKELSVEAPKCGPHDLDFYYVE